MLSSSSPPISRSFSARSKSHQHFIYAALQRLNPCGQITHNFLLFSFDILLSGTTRVENGPLRKRSKDQHPRLLTFVPYSALGAWLLTFRSRARCKRHA